MPAGFSTVDRMMLLGALAQQYGYQKSMQALERQGYQVLREEAVRSNGSRIAVLTKKDPHSDETHKVRLVIEPREGGMRIDTDSRRPDGSPGYCPEMIPLMEELGVADYRATEPRGPVVGEQETSQDLSAGYQQRPKRGALRAQRRHGDG